MPNGHRINEGEYLQEWFDGGCNFGYPGRQDMLVLQDPGYSDGYYMIHKRLERRPVDNKFDILNLSYSYIDMSLSDGLGDVTVKNFHFYTLDRFLWSYLTAIIHQNGSDWWIVNPAMDNKFYVFTLDEEGLRLSQAQDVGITFDEDYSSAGGDAKFSHDGTKYAYFTWFDGLLLYDFDRESGVLSNLRKLKVDNPEELNFATCEWSPNSEFLYLATLDSLWQVEVAYDDLEDGKEFIAEYNEVEDPVSTQFFNSTLGPDCRIYIRPGSSSYSMHVIHQPDKKGEKCRFVQQGIKLPELTSTGSFPNFPRFRVDEEEKCDPTILSIIGEPVWWNADLITYPNPAPTTVTLESKSPSDGDLYVIDSTGKIVSTLTDVPNYYCLDVSYLPQGTYTLDFIPYDNEGRTIYTSQLVVVR